MTEYYIRGRAQGKTHQLIELMLKNPNVIMVCINQMAADAAWKLAKAHDPEIDRSRFIGPQSLRKIAERSGAHSAYTPRLVFDNIEMILANMFRAEIAALSGTGTNRRFNETPGYAREAEWTYSPKYKHRKTGTVYHRVDLTRIDTGYVYVETEAASAYNVRSENLEIVT